MLGNLSTFSAIILPYSLPPKNVTSPTLHGISFMWAAYLQCYCSSVANELAHLLICSYYTSVDSQQQQQHQAFLTIFYQQLNASIFFF